MGKTISDAIGEDHQLFDEYYDNLKAATDDAAKARWRNQLTWTVARHAISEELTLYPAMEKHLGQEGVMLSKTDKEQHQAVKDQLAEIQDMSPVHAAFWPKLDTLIELLHHHVEHEREEDMPRLEKVLDRGESEELAKKFEWTKGIVPTQSHPAAPTSFYLEGLTALLAAPMDRFKDWMKDFPTEEDKRNVDQAVGRN